MSFTIKVAMLGQSTVGKTSIAQRFIYSNFKNEYPSTIGVSFTTKIIQIPKTEEEVKIQIWDTAGQEKFRSLATLYYKDVNAAIIVYDISNKETFEEAKFWVNELYNNGPENVFLIIAANKSDLINMQEVGIKEGEEYAKSLHAIFRQTSAKENIGINELFFDICDNVLPILKEAKANEISESAISKSTNPIKKATKVVNEMKKQKEVKKYDNCCN